MNAITTYADFQRQYQAIDARAHKLSANIVAEARKTAKQAGLDPSICFLHAHNAMCAFGTPAQWPEVDYRLCRRVLWLEQKSFEPTRIASQIYKRMWNRYAPQFNMPLYSESQIHD